MFFIALIILVIASLFLLAIIGLYCLSLDQDKFYL